MTSYPTTGSSPWGVNLKSYLDTNYVRVTEYPLNPFSPAYGAKGDGSTDDTAIIQQCLDDAYVNNGCRPVVLQPGRTSGGGQASIKFQQLRLNQGQVIDGGANGMFTTRLIRAAGTSGPAIREKTAGEGGSGAQGVSLRNLYLDCNSVTGNGVDLGNQGGLDWGFNGELESVHVRNASGDGFSLNADAVTGRNLSSYFNTGTGINITGHGQNNWFQVSTSRNGVAEFDLSGTGDTFYGAHIEPGAVAEAIIVRTQGVSFKGLTGFPYGSVTDLVDLVGSTSNFSMESVLYALNGGFTLTNWVLCNVTPTLTTATTGTGNIYLREWSDNKLGAAFWTNIDRGTKIVFDDYGRVKAHSFWLNTIQTKNTSTASYSVGDNDGLINMTGSTAGFTLTLPSATTYKGRSIKVKNSSTVSVTVAASAGAVDTTTLTTLQHGQYISDGSTWLFI